MKPQLMILFLTVLSSYLSYSQAADQQMDSNSMDKRQLVPLPRIGRSLFYPKRQSALIASPRIGRSDPSLKASKSANAVDCTANPDMCENTGSSGGFAGNNEDLVEPIDIQLRAAFIPRLGKRRVFMEEEHASENNGDSRLNRKWVLIPGLGYIDTEAANYAPIEQEEEESDTSPRGALLRSIIENAKRAIPYTPRIGRAVFAPRIGKKATFVPRIG